MSYVWGLVKTGPKEEVTQLISDVTTFRHFDEMSTRRATITHDFYSYTEQWRAPEERSARAQVHRDRRRSGRHISSACASSMLCAAASLSLCRGGQSMSLRTHLHT